MQTCRSSFGNRWRSVSTGHAALSSPGAINCFDCGKDHRLAPFRKSRRLLIARKPSDNRPMIGIKRRSGPPLVALMNFTV
jgi:hypothetical protein